jgi:protein-disulfide isomerase
MPSSASKPKRVARSTYESPRLTIPVAPDRDHTAGPASAPLTLVEYGDYQCPYCGAAYPEVKKVQKKLGARLRFVFRNFPITTAHQFAMRAAETAEAASAQGKFWEMHDFLYEHQDTLGDDQKALAYSKSLGLNVSQVIKELDLHTHVDRIEKDFMGGVRSGVNGTPTFFVNGVRYDGQPSAEDLLAALESSQ